MLLTILITVAAVWLIGAIRYAIGAARAWHDFEPRDRRYLIGTALCWPLVEIVGRALRWDHEERG